MAEQDNISPTDPRLVLRLEQLLNELETAGFARDRMGAPVRLRITELLNHLPDATSPEQLKYKLSALICQSAEEQTKFYAFFEAFAERFRSQEIAETNAPLEKKEAAPPGPPEPPPPKPEPPKPAPDAKTGRSKTDAVKAARSGPITVELNFRDDGYRPWNLPELESIVRPLREKEWTGAEEWDIPNTIRQTIRAGGAPHFARRRRRKAPQYLFLIEQKSARDHLAGFYADLVSELSRRDLDAEYYFFDRTPRQCWKDRRDPSTYITIDRINALHQLSRLILIGEPDGLLAVTGETTDQPEKVVSKIHLYPSPLAFQLRDDWPAVALLNTRSTALWGEVETAIHQLFPVAPANVAGLGSVMEQWKNRISLKPYFWKLECPEPIPPVFKNYDGAPETIQKDIKDLKVYLGRQGYTWLCAIAVYPEIYWQLTKILHDEAISKTDVPDESLRTQLWHLYLLRLSRLEWLRRGYIPPEYRRELRQGLPATNAVDVRRQLLEVLQLDENKPPEGSYAEKDRVYTVALFDHERFVTLENPDVTRLTAMKEKLRRDVEAVGVAASDIEDAVGRSLFRTLPEMPVETIKNYWVLWVDDSPGNNLGFQTSLAKEHSIQFVNVTRTEQALTTLQGQTFDLVVSDVSRFGDKEAGIKMMRLFNEKGIKVPTIFFTHPNYVTRHRELLQGLGAVAVLTGFKELQPVLLERILGKVVEYRETLSQIDFSAQLDQVAKAVCRVVMTDGSSMGTGFLAKDNYLFTTAHMISNKPEVLQAARLEFNYELDASGNATPVYSYQLDPKDFIMSPSDDLDFVRVKVIDRENIPLSQWGYIELEASDLPAEGDQVGIVHHANGREKQRELNTVVGEEDHYLYYGEDGAGIPGGTGAPVVNRQLKAVAMHRARIPNKAILGKTRTAVRQAVLFRDILAFVQKEVEKTKQADSPDVNTGLIQEADAVIERGRAAYYQQDFDAAMQQFQNALGMYIQANFDAGRAQTLHEIAKVLLDTGRLSEAKQTLESAFNISYTPNFQPANAYVQVDLGKVALLMGDYDMAESHYREALGTLEGLSGNMEPVIVMILMALSAIARAKGDPSGAKEQLLEALNRARKADLKPQETEVLNQLGAINLTLGEPQQAIECFEDALKLARSTSDQPSEALALENLAQALHLTGDAALAASRLNEARSLYLQLGDDEGKARLNKLRSAWEQESKGQTSGKQESTSPMQTLFEPGKTKLFLLYVQEDLEYGEGLLRHLKKASFADNISLVDNLQLLSGEVGTRRTRFEMEQALQGRPKAGQADLAQRARFEMEQADYVFVLLSFRLFNDANWFEMAYDALGHAKKVVPIMIEKMDMEGTGFEKLESLPRSSRNKTIKQFEDTEDAYFVIAREIGEIIGVTDAPPPKTNKKDEIRALIAEGNLQEALEMLQAALPNDDEVILLRARLAQLTNDELTGVIDSRDIQTTRNQIADAALTLANQLPDAATINREKERIRDLIAQGDVNEALKLLEGDESIKNEVLLLRSRVNELNKSRLRATISNEDYQNEFNRITLSALELADNFLGDKNPPAPAEDKTAEAKKQIRALIEEAKLPEALELLKQDTSISEQVILLQAQLNALNKNLVQNTIDRAEYVRTMNRINVSALELADNFSLKEISNSTKREGFFLTQIPKAFTREKETMCKVRIAMDENSLVEDLKVDETVEIKKLRVSDMMEVILTSDNDPAAIRTISSAVQMVRGAGYTEWTFLVTPKQIAEFQLQLQISVLEMVNEREQKRTILLDFVIPAQETPPDAPPFERTKFKIDPDKSNL